MPFAIRRLGPGDAAVLELLARDSADFDLAGRSGPDPPLARAQAERYLANPDILHWVAEDNGTVLGELLCHLLGMPHGSGSELLLYSIGVREHARRRGIGRALVDELRGWAGQAGVPEVWVLADNPGAERFYEACGFRRGRDDEQGTLLLLDTEPHEVDP
jgi:ribosomal protein S18 acetylase RimI-like enzyme